MVKKNLKKLAMFSLAVLTALSIITVPGIHAYLTDVGPTLENNFTIALDPTTTVVEKFPTQDPTIEGDSLIKFMKLVQIGNTGYIDCYVRVRFNFSDKDIRNKATFSWDGEHFYSYADYVNHLPEEWLYNAEDDCFYYTPMLYAGDWAELSKNLVYDKALGEYFYADDDNNILVNNMITTPLLKYVKVAFDNPKDMRTFTFDVVNESVPFYLGTDYISAWKTYDAETWDLHPDNGGN